MLLHGFDHHCSSHLLRDLAGVNISLYFPARAGEQVQKIGISEEEFLKFSCKMLHFVNNQRRKDELNEQILKIMLGKGFAFCLLAGE